MKISAQEEYSLRCLVQLAELSAGESLTLPQIAEREGISTANAGKLMWMLNKAGFVQSTRGTKGGYFLARPADEIRLSEIIKVLDAETVHKHCSSYSGVKDECVHSGDCGIRPVILGVHELVENALSQITLQQLVGSEKSFDKMFHSIQGLDRPIDLQRAGV